MLFEISMGVIALAVLVLVIYLIFVLRSVLVILKQSERLLSNVQFKVEALDSTFKAVSAVGDVASETAHDWRRKKIALSREEERAELDSPKNASSKYASLVELMALGFSLWLSKRKK